MAVLNEGSTVGGKKIVNTEDLSDYQKQSDTTLEIQQALSTAKEYTDEEITELIGGAPDALDTLYELSDALGNDPNFSTTVLNKIGEKVTKEDGKGLFSGSYVDLTEKPDASKITATGGTDVQSEIDSLKQSGSDAKSGLAAAITDMGVPASSGDTFAQLIGKIGSIETGGKVSWGFKEGGSMMFEVTGLDFRPSMFLGMTNKGSNDRGNARFSYQNNNPSFTFLISYGTNYTHELEFQTFEGGFRMEKTGSGAYPFPTDANYFWVAIE